MECRQDFQLEVPDKIGCDCERRRGGRDDSPSRSAGLCGVGGAVEVKRSLVKLNGVGILVVCGGEGWRGTADCFVSCDAG